MTVRLDDGLLRGKGSLRAVYIHPERSDCCIKIEWAPARTYRRFIIPWKRSPHIGANQREFEGYRQVVAAMPNRPAYFSWVGGFVETNFGTGLLVENINPLRRPMFSFKQVQKTGKLPDDAKFSDVASQIETLVGDFKRFEGTNHCVSPESIWFVQGDNGYAMRIVDYKTVASSSWSPIGRHRPWRWRRHFEKRLFLSLASIESAPLESDGRGGTEATALLARLAGAGSGLK